MGRKKKRKRKAERKLLAESAFSAKDLGRSKYVDGALKLPALINTLNQHDPATILLERQLERQKRSKAHKARNKTRTTKLRNVRVDDESSNTPAVVSTYMSPR